MGFRTLESRMAAVESTLAEVTTGAWVPWTFTLGSTGTPPNLGAAGSVWGRYSRQGRTVTLQCGWYFSGAGLNQGTGIYRIPLPVTGRVVAAAETPPAGAARAYNGTYYAGTSEQSGTDYLLARGDGLGGGWGAAAPFAWVEGTWAALSITYEAAA